MGKGDKKSRRGKIILGSNGVRRPSASKKRKANAESGVKTVKAAEVPKTPKPKAEPKPKVAEVVETIETETATPKPVKKTTRKPKQEQAE
jgi:30S ribosomal protein S31